MQALLEVNLRNVDIAASSAENDSSQFVMLPGSGS